MAEARSLDKRVKSQGGALVLNTESPSKTDAPSVAGAPSSRGERSSMRPETPFGGTAGLALPRKAQRAKAGPAAYSRPDRTEGFDDLLVISRSRQKPKKIYDKKAVAMARKAESTKAGGGEASGKARRAASGKAKLALALGLLIALGAGLSFALPEVTRVEKVTVNGMSVVSENEIVEALRLSPKVNLINADILAMESRVLANPKIAKVSVRRCFPDRLVVDIFERVPVACVLVTEEIGTKSIAVDAQGIAFACLDQASTLVEKLPVLSGIRFEHFQPGQSLPPYLVPLLGDLAELSKLSPSPLAAFSEIRVQKITDSEAELLLYPAGKTMPIRMPTRLNAANLGQALLVLDILAGREGVDNVEEIDFRTGTIVYKMKEAQAG
ncbi:MAG: FtsQ-type POTRA domain-containing protein [Spirochaetes bacterium]|nr:FtsQ-type POTRA domain-containing protein [Spirochaetota bacterium]